MSNKHEIIIKIETEEWNKALDKAFAKNVKEVKVDGFRKGKVPRNIYEKKYGKESLYKDAIDTLLPLAYEKLLKENDIIPIVQPQIDIKSVDDSGVEILFIITTKPDVKIKKYKGLKVQKTEIKITDNEVDEEIKKLQTQYAEIIVKDGPVADGDTVVIDFEGFKDKEPFKGGKAENYPLEIGSKVFIPGFEEQLIGFKTGDEKEVEVKFPEDYPSDELKDKKVIFKVKINEVKTKSIPKLDKDFFKDLNMDNVSNEKELFSALKDKLTKEKTIAAENSYLDNVLSVISKEVEVDIPKEMVDEEINRMVQQLEERLKMQGMNLEQYKQLTGADSDKFNNQFESEAKKNLLYRLMIEKVSELENIKVTDKEAKEELTKMAEKYQMKEEELMSAFGSLEMIKYDLKMRKTIEFLKENN